MYTVSLRSIRPDGGLVPCVDVVVLRRQPALYMVEYESGRRLALPQERFDAETRSWESDQAQAQGAEAVDRAVSVQMTARIKVADYCGAPGSCTALVSLWDSNPDVYAQVFEGRRIQAPRPRRGP